MTAKLHLLLSVLLTLSLTACTDEASTIKTLKAHGFTDIVVTGWEPSMCGGDDDYSTGFRAKNPHGEIVAGAVCCGAWTKGCTVRF